MSESVDGILLGLGYHISMLALLYRAVVTFRYYLNGNGRIGRLLNPLSYGTYIVHMIVLGAIAWALLDANLPALMKYPLLVVATYAGSNGITLAYRSVAARAKPGQTLGGQVLADVEVLVEGKGAVG